MAEASAKPDKKSKSSKDKTDKKDKSKKKDSNDKSSKKSKDLKEPKLAKEPKEPKEPKQPKEPKEPKQSKPKQPEPKDESDSESEEEDDMGDLVTADIDRGISDVLEAIRNNPEKLKDPSVNFFPEIGAEGAAKERKEKPMYLKDYHRENLLAGNHDQEEPAEDRPETYYEQQSREKAEFLNQLKDDSDEEGSDDGFLTKRKETREIEPAALPNPDEDAEGFLAAFVGNKGWMPKGLDEKTGDKKVPTYSEVVDEDSDEFDDIAEKFESGYNFRFEDPSSVDIVSYARDQNTARRKEDGSRRKARDRKRELREKEENQRKFELAQLRKTKVSEVSQKLEKLSSILGDDEISGKFTAEDLEGEWDDTEWDKRMQKLFDEEFYAKEDASWKPAKGDETAADETVADEGDEADEADTDETPANNGETAEIEQEDAMEVDVPESAAAALAKMSKRELKRKAEEIVDANTDLLLDETFRPSETFKYRDVEPESFGLSARDILLADDKALNQYVGLKHLASFREPEKISKDRKRYAKKRRLREWRNEAFGQEEVDHDQLWEQLKKDTAAVEEPPRKRAKKTKRKGRK